MAKLHPPRVDFDGRALVDEHGPHRPRRIVLHDTEGSDAKGTKDLEALGRFWELQGRGFGSHIAVDGEGLTGRYVSDKRIAWHVQDHNTGSLGIEQIGRASFLRKIWLARPRQLRKVAKWIAYWSQEYDIPLKRDVNAGVSTHAMQSKAFGGDHTDPGRGYPFHLVLLIAHIYKRIGFK